MQRIRPNSSPRAKLALAASLTSLIMTAGLQAADTTPAATNAPTSLPPVIVRAQKAPENVQNLPVSATAVTKDTIDNAGIRYVNDAAMYSPNSFITEFSARKLSNPRFRGVGSSPANPGITTYIDGIPILNANASSMELIDIDQIEFVRGPQSALFGRNTVGGLINITSTRPSLDRATGYLSGTYGNFDLWDVRAGISGPVIENELALGAGFGFSTREGYTKNTVTGNDLDSREAFFGKGQLLWKPAENWEVRFILAGERARDGDYALGDLAGIRATPHKVARDFEGFTHRDIIAPTLLVTHAGEKVDFAMNTGVVWWETEDLTDLDYTPAPLITRDNKENALQFTHEFRLGSAKDAPIELGSDLKLAWLAGVSLFKQDYRQNAANNFAPFVLSPFIGFPVTQTSPLSTLDDTGFGAFLKTTLTAWEKLDISAGLRVDHENKEANLQTFFAPVVAAPTLFKGQRSFTDISPQFSLAYHITPAHTAYAAVSRGFKAGGFNPIAPPGSEPYEEEHTWNYELGVKTSWLDNRITANFAAFYTDWENLQLNVPLGGGAFFINNVGGAYSRGLELEVTARALPGWDIFVGGGVQEARFKAGTTDFNSNTGFTQSISGNKVPYTPDYTISAGTQYSIALCEKVTAYARAEIVAYGNFQYDSVNGASQSSYSLANFRAGLRGKHWSIEGWVRNAFDTDYVPLAFQYGALAPSGYVGESGAPVTFGVSGTVRF